MRTRLSRATVALLLGLPSITACRGEPPNPAPNAQPDAKQPADPPEVTPEALDALLDETRDRYADQDLDGALSVLDRATPLAKTDADRARIASARAVILARQGQPVKAAKMAEDALATLTEAGGPTAAIAEAENAVGAIAMLTMDLEGALTHWERALAVDDGEEPAAALRRGRVRFNMATVLTHLGRVDEALTTAEQGLSDEQAGGAAPCPHLAITRQQIASLHQRREALDRAEAVLREALATCEDVDGARVVWADLQVSLGDVLGKRGQTEDALDRIGRARRVFEADPELLERAAASFTVEASVLKQAGRNEEALALLTEARASMKGRLAPDRPANIGLCLQTADLLRTLGRRDALEVLVRDCKTTAEAAGPEVVRMLDALLVP